MFTLKHSPTVFDSSLVSRTCLFVRTERHTLLKTAARVHRTVNLVHFQSRTSIATTAVFLAVLYGLQYGARVEVTTRGDGPFVSPRAESVLKGVGNSLCYAHSSPRRRTLLCAIVCRERLPFFSLSSVDVFACPRARIHSHTAGRILRW